METIAFERRRLIKSVLKTFLLTILVLPFIVVFLSLFEYLGFFLAALIVFFILIKSISSGDTILETIMDQITLIPVHYSEKEWVLERQLRATPVLILLNLAVHYTLFLFDSPAREALMDSLSFLPEKLHLLNLVLSPIASMFLHADADHLWWNMIYFWIFGLTLERRIGWRQFALFYLLTGILSNILSAFMHILFLQKIPAGIGASGALSGIIGVFAVRLFFKRLVFPIPIFGLASFILPLNFKIRVNFLFIIGLYFIHDLLGGGETLLGLPNSIDYWAHIGGMIAGFVLGWRSKLQDTAIQDMYIQKSLQAMESELDGPEAEKFLRRVLELNPENEEALLTLAWPKSKPVKTGEGMALYQKIIHMLLETRPERAAEIFAEYFPIYRISLDPAGQSKLTSVLEQSGWPHIAARALEALSDDPRTPAVWGGPILFQMARLLEKLQLREAACFRYEQLLERYPNFKKDRLSFIS